MLSNLALTPLLLIFTFQVMKDAFRTFYLLPSVRKALQCGSHMHLYHSDYLLPLGEQPQENELACAILRKVFDAQVSC